jgi:RNA-directed DNA polymerase
VRDIWVFLDESGTHAKAERLLVGAVVAPDREAVESAVVEAFAHIASQSANWRTAEEIEAFIGRGFHFTQDNVSVRNEFVRQLSTMNIRIHAAYSASGKGRAWRTRAAAMYYQLVRGILARYRHCAVHFAFERETGMNRMYQGIIELAARSVVDSDDEGGSDELTWDVSVAGKDDPALAVVDYVLASLSFRLSVMRQGEFEARYAQAFAGHVAHLLNYDKALRYSSRASTLPLAGAGGHDGRARGAPGSRRSQHVPMTPQPSPLAGEGVAGLGADGDHAERMTSEIPVTAVVSEVPALALSRVGVPQLPSFAGTSARDLAVMLERLDAGGCYREVQIWMKGRPRRVEIPEDDLAQVQRRILGRLAEMELDLPGCVHGYVRGRSHISNATAHAGRRHLQKFDLKDFFPSVSRAAVVAVLGEAGFTPAASDCLGRLLTYRGRLPLGACTSPLLSNLCLRTLDAELQALAIERGLVYTRYSDDLAFSANEPFDVRAEVRAVVRASGFRLNSGKTVTVRYGQALYVTGLSVSDQAGPRLPKRFKRELRRDLYVIEKFGLFSYNTPSTVRSWDGEEDLGSVSPDDARRPVEGRLRYARAVEPAFVDKLAREFPGGYAIVAEYPDLPRDVGRYEKSLMAALDGRWPTPARYQGTRHYSTEF